MAPLDSTSQIDQPARPDLSRGNVEGVLSLRPLQQAMLFYLGVENKPAENDPGFIQVRFRVEGPIDEAALTRAWEAALERHAALRMSIHGSKQGVSRIVTWKELPLPIVQHDWRSYTDAERTQRYGILLDEDRQTGLDVQRPPVMRLTVIRVADQITDVLWSCHHLFLDGWSTMLVIDEVLGLYEADVSGTPQPPWPTATPADYLAWIKRQDASTAASFWRAYLEGFTPPQPLRVGFSNVEGHSEKVADLELPAELSGRLNRAGAEYQLTANSLLQGAWALTLSTLLGVDDVVFGTTASGRDASLPGLESAIGLFANVLPVRVVINEHQSIRGWLGDLLDASFASATHQYSDLGDIQAWSGVGGGRPLLESLLLVENFPQQAATSTRADKKNSLRLSDYASGITSTYPLTITVIPGERWRVSAQSLQMSFNSATLGRMLNLVGQLLEHFVDNVDQPLACCLQWLESTPLAQELSQYRAAPSSATNGAVDAIRRFDAPSEVNEVHLARIWQRALGVSPIGVNDNFFELGGRSVTAVCIFSQIEEHFGKRLPLTSILERPTIKELAPLIVETQSPEPKTVVPLRTTGNQTPIFFVHGGAEEAFLFRGLTQHLGPDQPVYVMLALHPGETETVPTTIEEMASHYIDHLRKVQETGPYRIVGYCFGGTVSFEMTRQLLAAGDKVELLAIIDAPAPFPEGPPNAAYRFKRMLKSRGVPYTLAHTVRYTLGRPLGVVRNRLSRRFGGVQGQREADLAIMRGSFRAAYLAYRPDPIATSITMIRSSENDWISAYIPENWEGLATNVDTHYVPGGHITMLLDPAVEDVAGTLESALASNDPV